MDVIREVNSGMKKVLAGLLALLAVTEGTAYAQVGPSTVPASSSGISSMTSSIAMSGMDMSSMGVGPKPMLYVIYLIVALSVLLLLFSILRKPDSKGM
jgi:hypothetical protein